jgi:hypothetical protein
MKFFTKFQLLQNFTKIITDRKTTSLGKEFFFKEGAAIVVPTWEYQSTQSLQQVLECKHSTHMASFQEIGSSVTCLLSDSLGFSHWTSKEQLLGNKKLS